MDISDIVESIEQQDDKTDKCICYAEIILFLKDVYKSINYNDTGVVWKNRILERLNEESKKVLRELIEDLRKYIEFTVKY